MNRLKIVEGRRRRDPNKSATEPAFLLKAGAEVVSEHATREEAEAALADLRAKHVPERRVHKSSKFDQLISDGPGKGDAK